MTTRWIVTDNVFNQFHTCVFSTFRTQVPAPVVGTIITLSLLSSNATRMMIRYCYMKARFRWDTHLKNPISFEIVLKNMEYNRHVENLHRKKSKESDLHSCQLQKLKGKTLKWFCDNEKCLNICHKSVVDRLGSPCLTGIWISLDCNEFLINKRIHTNRDCS